MIGLDLVFTKYLINESKLYTGERVRSLLWGLLGIVLTALVLFNTLQVGKQSYPLSLSDLSIGIEEALAKPQRKPRLEVKILEGKITSIGEKVITIESSEFTGELIAIGKWLLISANDAGVYSWSDVKHYVSEGDALIVVTTISRRNKTLNVLLALKQGDVILVRPIVLRYYAKGLKHTKLYMGIYCKVVGRRGPYLVVERNGFTGLLMADPNGKWYKAGYGEVTWNEIVDEFKEGDLVRVFCHNVLVMKEEFSEKFGISFIVWSYSGSIIDLTSGVAITKIAQEE